MFRCPPTPWYRLLALLLLAGASLPLARAADAPASADRGYRYYAAGNLQAPTPQPPALGLMLMGGGEYVDDAFAWFVERAGHGHIVVLRASGGDDLQHEFYERLGGITSVQTFVFERAEGASDPFLLEAVTRADGIFLAGGDQARYIRLWKGTPLNKALDRHVEAGKPLGGTSAGLAILGRASYGALDGGSISSRHALSDPLGDAVTMDHDFLHLPFLSRVVTDSHFGKRDRLGRLVTFLTRAEHDGLVEKPIGIGVDENTALCIDAEGIGRVFTGSGGHAWLVHARRGQTPLQQGKPLSVEHVAVTLIGPDSRLDLATFQVDVPAFTTAGTIDEGELELDPDLPSLEP